jgi:7,8-dihydroneopterin aldolase/epimerase/oxygenase
MDTIRIEGIEVFGYHGVFPDEHEAGQLFLIDLVAQVDLAQAVSTDRLSDTLDYGQLAQTAHDIASGERFDLIESVAGRIAAALLEDERISNVEVTVHKPQAPIPVPFGDVMVTVRRP